MGDGRRERGENVENKLRDASVEMHSQTLGKFDQNASQFSVDE